MTKKKGKIVYDYSLLIDRIDTLYGSQLEFAKAMGISVSTISKKLSNKVDWRQDEIEKACKVLGIKKEFISKIFFNTKDQLDKDDFFYD